MKDREIIEMALKRCEQHYDELKNQLEQCKKQSIRRILSHRLAETGGVIIAYKFVLNV